MGNREQWVNLPSEDSGSIKRSNYTDGGASSVDAMGRTVFIEATFDNKDAAAVATCAIVPDGDNASYDKKEFALAADTAAVGKVTEGGKAKFSVKLSAAGGDKFKISVKDKDGTEKQTETFETRRALYYQVLRIKAMVANDAILTSHFASEYWNDGKKHYIKLTKIAAKGEITGRSNYDRPQQGELTTVAAGQYNRDKDPFCVALLLVDQLAASSTEQLERKVKVAKGTPETLDTKADLWVDLDPAGTPQAQWVLSATFEDEKGASQDVDLAKVTAPGKAPTTKITVDLSQFPDGTSGTLKVKAKVVDYFRTGLSLGANVICVATRDTWKQRDDDEMKSTLVHEAGHKIGMVPSGVGGLLKQPTWYDHPGIGNHCNHGGNKCVMYHAIYAGRPNVFCSDCNKSVRRIDIPQLTPL